MLAERLAAVGYATGMVGKWHLGYREGLRPTECGFQEFFGFLAGAHGYRPTAVAAAKPEGVDPTAAPNPILRGTTPVAELQWLTVAFVREAVAFVDKHRRNRSSSACCSTPCTRR